MTGKPRAIVRNGTWRPGIGDPTVGGWITVVLYFAAVLTTWRAAQFTEGREQKLWLLIALMFIFLGINKQLDLQSALTEAGRILAIKQGWYAARRIVVVYRRRCGGLSWRRSDAACGLPPRPQPGLP